MRYPKIALMTLLASALFIGGYAFGSSRADADKEAGFRELESQGQDAIIRYSAKTDQTIERAMANRFARAMRFPFPTQGSGKVCTQLKLKPGSVGGSPVYCYREGTTKLIEEYSEVE